MAYSIKNVFKGATIYSLGQMLTSASSFLLIPLYTRFLSPGDYGILGYLDVLISVMCIILMFGFSGSQTRFYYDFNDRLDEIGEFLFSTHSFIIGILVLFCLTVTFAGGRLYGIIYPVENIAFSPFIIIAVWIVFFRILNQLTISYYMASKQFKICALYQILYFIFTTMAVLYLVVIRQFGALGKISGVLIGEIIFFVIFYSRFSRLFKYKFKFGYIKKSLLFGLPVVVHLLSSSIHITISRLILERYVSLDQLGIYSLGFTIGMVLSLFIVSINKAWMPNYYDLMKDTTKDHKYEVKRIFYVWLFLIAAICLAGQLWSREVLLLLVPESYQSAYRIVPVILFGYLLNGIYFFFSAPIQFFKKTKKLPIITITSGGVCLLANLIMIPSLGIIGAAYSSAISFVVMVVISYYLGAKYFNPGYEMGKIMFVLAFLSVFSFTSMTSSISFLGEIEKILILVLFLSTYYWLFRRYIAPFKKHLRIKFQSMGL